MNIRLYQDVTKLVTHNVSNINESQIRQRLRALQAQTDKLIKSRKAFSNEDNSLNFN